MKLFLSLNANNLSFYYDKGIILPSKFIGKNINKTTNRAKDMQSLENDYIVLSKYKFLNDSDCSIEVEIDREYLEKNNDIYLYKFPISISRVIKIYFKDEEKKNIVKNTINETTAFINENILEVSKEENKFVEIKEKEFQYNQDLKEKIKNYDMWLGGLALSRCDFDEKYTFGYLGFISNINKQFKILKEKIEEIQNASLESFKKGFEKVRNKQYNLLQINDEYYKNGRKNYRDFISEFKNGKLEDKYFYFNLFLLGLKSGYSNLENSYKVNNDYKLIKYKMDSKFDYYTIESLFQFVFFDKVNNDKFELIDYLNINKEIKVRVDYKYVDVLDERVYYNEPNELLKEVKEFDTMLDKISMSEFFQNYPKKIKNFTIKLTDKLKNYENKIIELSKKLSKEKENNFVLQKENEKLKIELSHLDNLFNNDENNKEVLLKVREKLEGELADKQNEIDKLKKENEELKSKFEDLFEMSQNYKKDFIQSKLKDKGIEYKEKTTIPELIDLYFNGNSIKEKNDEDLNKEKGLFDENYSKNR